MRSLSLIGVLALCGCGGFRTLERGDWVLVWTDESVQTQMVNGTPIEVVKPAPGARKELIPQDRYDSEVAEGKRRKAMAGVGVTPKLVTEVHEPVVLTLGEVRELRIEEREEVQVFVSGKAVRPYWTVQKDVAAWKGDQPDDHKESSLFLKAEDLGATKVRVQYPGKQPVVIDVTVREK
jgi:hypothetical protein